MEWSRNPVRCGRGAEGGQSKSTEFDPFTVFHFDERVFRTLDTDGLFAQDRSMNLARISLTAGAALGAVAVALGAFGAHALRGVLDTAALATWHTAVEYQFWHALALIGCGVLAQSQATAALRIATCAFIVGCPLFCGSLYGLALGAPRIVGIVTPIGGVTLIAGWIALAACAWRKAA